MDKKNSIDPIKPPEPKNTDSILSNQTPKPHPEQGNPDAFLSPTKDFDEITAKILEEAPPMPQPSAPVQPLPPHQDNPSPTMPGPFGQTNAPADKPTDALPKIPDTSIKMGGTKKSILKWKMAIIGLIGILILTVGGVSAYKGDFYWIRDVFGMGIPSDAKKAVLKADENTSKLDSYQANLDMNLTGNINDSDIKFLANIDGAEKPKEKKANIKLNSLEIDIPKEITGNVVDLNKINKTLPGLEGTLVDNTSYIKIPSVNDSWYQIDESSVNDAKDINNFIPAIFSRGANQNINPLTAAVAYSTTSISEDLNVYDYLTNIKKVGEEKVDGKGAYHYQANIDIAKVLEESGASASGIDKYLTSKVDIWVAKKEMVFSKFSISMDFNMNLADFGETGDIRFALKVDTKIKDFNKDITIEAPSDTKKFDEKVFEDIVGGKSIDVPNTRNARRKSDMQILETALEQYYADNKSYPITTADSKNGNFIKELLDDKYLTSSIKDPSHPTYYYSYVSVDGKSYVLTYVEETSSGIKVQKITK